MVLLIILVLLLVGVALVSLYRLIMLRRGGTAAILRVLPAQGGQGWRHGLIRYGESRLVFYKLTSLKVDRIRPSGGWVSKWSIGVLRWATSTTS
ncbi:Protein of uncharacterised function (DUF2550) [Nocardia africana]|uniref:Protein of uncharacterized function (DUF2550) n=1 Tax=Nocardia africana TaxID=134964 RepID=A0A378WN12_9NOCA|nr:Protein of uncharacterised function (DUF2550) [Nocardia africana]